MIRHGGNDSGRRDPVIGGVDLRENETTCSHSAETRDRQREER